MAFTDWLQKAHIEYTNTREDIDKEESKNHLDKVVHVHLGVRAGRRRLPRLGTWHVS